MFWFFSTAIFGFSKMLQVLASPYDDFPNIEIYDNKFFNSVSQEQFFMKGIAYQPKFPDVNEFEDLSENSAEDVYDTEYIDPLSDPKICLRDIPYLVKLGVNTIRVYSINPLKNHDICMEELMNNNIYVVTDLSEPNTSIIRNDPHWDNVLWERYKSVIDCMIKYPNLLGVFAGNEVTNDITNTYASPFVKAAIRDLKQYLVEKNYRKVPIGYSTNDDVATRDNLAKYFICGDVSADFYGINMYEWCGYSSFETSGYKERTDEFKNYPIPIIFSEFGCNLVRPRPFTEIKELYGKEMSKVWSGGIVYMYFEEENEYGVVKVDNDGRVIELEDFKNLQKAYGDIRIVASTKEKAPTNQASDKLQKSIHCPSINYSWKANEKLPPTPDFEKCDCLNGGIKNEKNILPCLVEPFDDDEKYEKIFNYVCNIIDCSDIITDGEKGDYGTFSDCSIIQKLNLQISKLYWFQNSNKDRCLTFDENVLFNTNYKNSISKGSKSNKLVPEHCFTILDNIRLSLQKDSNENGKTKGIGEFPSSNSVDEKNKKDEANNKKPEQDNKGNLRRIKNGNIFAILFIIMSTCLIY